MTDQIIKLRRTLHHYPELSGREEQTAKRISSFIAALNPDDIIENLGGNGVAVIFAGKLPGPTLLFRAELDAVPIQEKNDFDYCSAYDGISHKCGHDGHMATLAAVGMELAHSRPARGRVVLLFQPAEETGVGAAKVVNDHRFSRIQPDLAFALHNLPGYPLGQVIVRNGAFNCASRGMSIRLTGITAHAAQPETGVSPAEAMCRIIQSLSNLPPAFRDSGETVFATVVGSQLGRKTFGTAPDKAEIWATLRSETDKTMAYLVRFAEQVSHDAAKAGGLQVAIHYEDIFQATVNSERAVKIVCRAAEPGTVFSAKKPLRWSEDFGRITADCEGALIGIGAGKDMFDLHNPDYDFPEALIDPAKELLMRIMQLCLGSS